MTDRPLSSEQIIQARDLVSAALNRLTNIVPPKWETGTATCIKVERDQILTLLREALALLPENIDKPAYIWTGQHA